MRKYLTEEKIKELLTLNDNGCLYHKESKTLEFKESFHKNIFGYIKDFLAFANASGGYIIFGIKDKPRKIMGLTDKSLEAFDDLDLVKIQENIVDYVSKEIKYETMLYSIDDKKIGFFYIYEATEKPIMCVKTDDKEKISRGDIYYRYGGKKQKIKPSELETIINQRIDLVNKEWSDIFTKVGRIGVSNARILNMEDGCIEKEGNKYLIDKEILKGIELIEEGKISEKEGIPTLKVIGTVEVATNSEVVRIVEENILAKYPLTWQGLWKKVKNLEPTIKQPQFNAIIQKYEMKKNTAYSRFNFKSKEQQDNYEKNPKDENLKGIQSIYNNSAIDYIVQIYQEEQSSSMKKEGAESLQK